LPLNRQATLTRKRALATTHQTYGQRPPARREQKANLVCYAFRVDEGRKRVLLIAATILAARKLAQFDKPCPGIEAAFANSVAMAEKIMRKIDASYPAKNGNDAVYKY
jgi:hypothetical protein